MKTWFRSLIILVLLGCFCIQVWDGFLKFVKRQTTIVTKKTKVESLRLPAVSFCPGFKDLNTDYYERSEDLGNLLEDDEGTLTPLEMWLDDTYDIHEILENIMAPGPWHTTSPVVLNKTGFYNHVNITLHELSTGYGRCYAVHFSDYLIISEDEFFTLKFNMSNHKELFLYIHEDYNEVGQHWGYYPILPTQVILVRNGHYTIDVQKNLFKPFGNKDCSKDEVYSYPLCIVNWARKRYIQMFEENNQTACWIPDTQYYAMNSNIKECQSKEMADWTRGQTYSELTENLGKPGKTGCERRCVRNSLKVTTIREPSISNTKDESDEVAFVYYGSIFESDEYEEVMLYDFNNIVSAMGGSLSLFLGISAFSIITYISNKFYLIVKNRKGNSHTTISLFDIKKNISC